MKGVRALAGKCGQFQLVARDRSVSVSRLQLANHLPVSAGGTHESI
jgi:hypothetical protein